MTAVCCLDDEHKLNNDNNGDVDTADELDNDWNDTELADSC